MLKLTDKEVRDLKLALEGFIHVEQNCAGYVEPELFKLDIKLGAYLVSIDDQWAHCKGCGEVMRVTNLH